MIRKIALVFVLSLLLLPIISSESLSADSSIHIVTTGYAFEYEESLDQKYTYSENAVPYSISAETGKITDPFGNVYLYNSLSNTFWSKSEMMYFYDSDYNGCFDICCYISEDNKKGYFVHDDVYYYSKGSDNERAMRDFIFTADNKLPECDLVLESTICMYKIEYDHDNNLFFNNVDHRDQNRCLIEPSVLRYNKCAGEDATIRVDSNDKSLICYPSTTYRGTIVKNGVHVGETVKLDYYNGLLSLTFSTDDITENLTVGVSVTTQGLKSVEDTGNNNSSLFMISVVLIVICVFLSIITIFLKYKK